MPKLSPLLPLLFSFLFLASHAPQREMLFDIKPTSKLFFKGTSNINEFSCECERYTHAGKVALWEADHGNINFRDARLSVAIASFDCGNSGINKDMGRALRSDMYPNIMISLKELVNNPALRAMRPGAEESLHAVVDISLAGVTREFPLNLRVKEFKADHYRITAQKTLYMTDFGVEPPTALFGLIKVNDMINIAFDLDLSLIPR